MRLTAICLLISMGGMSDKAGFKVYGFPHTLIGFKI